MIGIYRITNPKGESYVGESVNIEKRWTQYKNKHYSKQWKLARSFEKYGYENHTKEVLEECSIQDLKDRERYYQLLYNSIQKGLNLKLTGKGEVKTLDSEEVRVNRIKGQTGRKHSQETKDKLSRLKKGVPKPLGFGDIIRQRFLGKRQAESHISQRTERLCKKCSVDGVLYPSIKEAARLLKIPKGTLQSRLKSKSYPNCFFIEKF